MTPLTRERAEEIDKELRTGRIKPFTSVTVQKLTTGWCVSLCVASGLQVEREQRWLVRSEEEWTAKRSVMRHKRLSRTGYKPGGRHVRAPKR